MSVIHVGRQASIDEIAAEMDRRGAVIENLEAERNLFKGKYRSMASLMEEARSQIRQVSDHTEDEGDRVYFGSSNHADWLQALAEHMESWVIDFDLPKGDINKMERDPYAAIREQRARAEKAEATVLDLVAAMKLLSATYDGIYVKMSDEEMELCREAWKKADEAMAKAEGTYANPR